MYVLLVLLFTLFYSLLLLLLLPNNNILAIILFFVVISVIDHSISFIHAHSSFIIHFLFFFSSSFSSSFVSTLLRRILMTDLFFPSPFTHRPTNPLHDLLFITHILRLNCQADRRCYQSTYCVRLGSLARCSDGNMLDETVPPPQDRSP